MSANGGALGIGTASDEVQISTIKELEKESHEHDRSSSDPSMRVEKGDMIDVSQRNKSLDEGDGNQFLSHEEQFPEDPDAPEEQQLTFRAIFVGCCLGGIIAASK